MPETYVILKIEPSKRLSEMLGFPYFIERRFTLKELLDKNIISEADIAEMTQGTEVAKEIKVI